MAKLIPVDAYIRVSRVGGREGEKFIAPKLQRESIERVCVREGLRAVKWFEELDASGGDSTRPRWNEAISRVEEGKTRGIVCWNLSRFSRSLKDALVALERVEAAGGKLYSEEGDLGKLGRTILLAVAEDERDRARAGFRQATADALSRGVYIAARIPFGYERDPETRKLVPDPERAAVVRELFERRALGESWRQLSRWATEAHSVYLAKSTLSGMLANPAYLGHARQGAIVNEQAHEPIISRLLWDRAQAARGVRPIHTGSASEGVLLRSIVSCEACGHKLVIGTTQGARKPDGKREKVPGYYCRNGACDAHTFVRADRLDSEVVERIMSYLNQTVPAKLKTTSDEGAQQLAIAERELEEAEHALSVFKDNLKAITILGVGEWNRLLEDYTTARDLARMEVDTLSAEDPSRNWEALPDLWDEWTSQSRCEFLQRMIRDCVVAPAHRKKVPVTDRLSLRLHGRDDQWLLRDGEWEREPGGGAVFRSKLTRPFAVRLDRKT